MVEIAAQSAFSELARVQTLALKHRAGETSVETTDESTLDWSQDQVYLYALLKSAGVKELQLQACVSMAQDDSRFEFLISLPDSAAIGKAAGDALELAIFGSLSQDVGEIAALIQIFSRLLDRGTSLVGFQVLPSES